jgi:hypothetical protein
MTDLHQLLDELARTPAPMAPLRADQAYAAGRRRHRRNRWAAVGGAAALAAIVLGTAAVAIDRPDHSGPVPASARTDPRPATNGAPAYIIWAGAADSTHLYISYMICASPCAKDRVDLVGSDDGGRTWTTRTAGLAAFPVFAGDRSTVVATTTSADWHLLISVDSGRSWSTPADGTADAAPPGTDVICPPVSWGCQLSAVDPATGTVVTLANPPIDIREPVVEAGGRLWISGVERATGRPAVATSSDRGRTWTSSTFPELGRCTATLCDTPELSSADGVTVVASFVDSATRRLIAYRGGLDGWQRLDTSGITEVGTIWSFTTADGTHIVRTIGRLGGGGQFWAAARTAQGYVPITLDALPDTVNPVQRSPDGSYHTYTPTGLYGSADGLHWTLIAGS